MTASGTAAPRILLLDDDPAYCAQIAAYLELYGFSVDAVNTARAFGASLAAREPDVIILDQRLGETTATDILRQLRPRLNTPCIVVTGASDPLDRVVNLEIGADDEVEKSVPPRELLARIRALLRRARHAPLAVPTGPVPQAPAPPAQAGGWSFSDKRRELRRGDGRRCRLTTAEFEVLRILESRRGEPVSRSDLMEAVFARTWKPDDRAVDTVVRKLRRKIGGPDGDGGIKTVRPTGYVFVGFPDDATPATG